tara:strand:+ start:3158 stop:4099 length:942 start_codon:yes stop_codon:yes gene_type:complete
MNINNTIKTSIMNTIFTFTLCFAPTVVLAESGHGDEEKQNEGGGDIELTQAQIKHTGISFSQVGSGNIRETLPVYGVITRNAEQVQSVSARFEGVIRSVKKSIGDHVRKGDVLAMVEANESFKTYSVLSSLKGVITQRNVNVGEQTRDNALFVIENFSTVWVNLSLFPEDVSKVKLGQSVRIKSANNAISGEGDVIYISPLGNNDNQATTVRVLLNNADNLWKPGLFVKADITLSETLASTVILNEALQLVEGKTILFVKGEDVFEPREIILGRSDGEFSEVLSGLNAGETYVVKNSFVLKSEMGKEDAEHGD